MLHGNGESKYRPVATNFQCNRHRPDGHLRSHAGQTPVGVDREDQADFYTQDVAGAKPQEPPENKTPVATKITGKMILKAIRQMDAEERRELTRVLFA